MKELIISLICACLGMNINGEVYNAMDDARAAIQYGIETGSEVEKQKEVEEDKNEQNELLSAEEVTCKTSYEQTLETNAYDKQVIDNCSIDFSEMKITVMGDSITAGNTLSDEEQPVFCWPSQLKEILGCKEIVNLGIGGSVVSSCADNYPMCERWSDIEHDSDIIIVMGGTNDMMFENREMFGSTDIENGRLEGTFCGDLDSMLDNIYRVYMNENDYKDSRLIYIIPPSTIKNDEVYMQDPDNMVKQEEFAEAINTIASEHYFEVIDLYNDNILNSHDPMISELYMDDEVHCNKDGYSILAEHIASHIIQGID